MVSKNILSFLVVLLSTCYAVAQKYEWAQPLSTSQAAYCQDMVIDNIGNTYVTGYYFGDIDFDPSPATSGSLSNGNSDLFFAKYDANGSLIWGKSIGGPLADISYSIALDLHGNVLLAGNFSDSADFDPGVGVHMLYSYGSSDMFFAKYDSNGDLIWAHNLGGDALGDYCKGIGSDSYGNVYIGGNMSDSVDFDPGVDTAYVNYINSSSIFIAKYDPDGNFIWTLSFDQSILGNINDLKIDQNNNINVTGNFQGSKDFDPGVNVSTLSAMGTAGFTARYDQDGNYLWAGSVAASSANNGCNRLAVAPSGDVYVTGYFNKSTVDFDSGLGVTNITYIGNTDAFVMKYNSDGTFAWANPIGSTSWDDGYSVATDTLGNVYVTGVFWSTVDFDPSANIANLTSIGFRDIYFAKYDKEGNYLWAKSIGSGNDDRGRGIAVDNDQNVYLAGHYQGTADFDPGKGTALLQTNGSYYVFISHYSYDSCNTLSSFIPAVLTACANDTISLTNSSVNAIEYEWKLGNDLFSLASDTSILFPVEGTHTIRLIAKNGACSDSSEVSIAVFPVYNRIDTILEICNGDSILIGGLFQSLAGTYSTSFSSVNYCDSIVSAILLVNTANINSSFSVSASNVCEGDTVILQDESTEALEYLWKENGVAFSSLQNSSKVFSSAGSYTISLTVFNGSCSDSLGIQINVHNSYFIYQDSLTICAGDSVLIYGVYRSEEGVYFQHFSSINSCDSIMLTALSVQEIDTSLVLNGNTLTANEMFASYQWLDCLDANNPIITATNQSFTPLDNGSYSVAIDWKGCLDTSSCHSINVVGIVNKASENRIQVYPNPTSGKLFVSGYYENKKYKILDIYGKELDKGNLNIEHTEIDISSFAKGSYFLSVEDKVLLLIKL